MTTYRRPLDTSTLDAAAKHFMVQWLADGSRKSASGKVYIAGPEYVLQCFSNFHFKDEFEYLMEGMKARLQGTDLANFEKAAHERFKPRDDKMLARLLKEKLAVDVFGNHIEGAIGTVEISRERVVDRVPILMRRPIVRPVNRGDPGGPWHITGYREYPIVRPMYWPIYAGEGEERAAGRSGPDILPPHTEPLPVGVNVTNISAELCIAALDQVTIRLEEGSAAALITGRTGAQPADPDAAASGTLIFTLTMTEPNAFAGAVDDTDGSCSATAAAITDDVSADNTNTLGYCRFSAQSTTDDHIDGNVTTDGTGATDWNTLAIVSGSTVSMTSCIVGMSQGSTAS